MPTCEEIFAFCLGGGKTELADETWEMLRAKHGRREAPVAATHTRCRGKVLRDGEEQQCGSNRIKIDTAQTRSADEGQSCFFLCRDCGNSWHEAG